MAGRENRPTVHSLTLFHSLAVTGAMSGFSSDVGGGMICTAKSEPRAMPGFSSDVGSLIYAVAGKVGVLLGRSCQMMSLEA